ncbi:MAG: PQQ-binding-like beta-propeller repeat protein [Halobaculum sp.]
MPEFRSRRSLLAGLAALLAGCSAADSTPTQSTSSDTPEPTAPRDPLLTNTETSATDSPTQSPTQSETDEPTPTESDTPSPTATEQVEHLPADDPALAWAVRLPRAVVHRPAVSGDSDTVYVAAGETELGTPAEGEERTDPGRLFSLAAADGTEHWRVQAEAGIVGRPVTHDGRIHLVTGYNRWYTGDSQRVVAFGPDGTRRWRTDPRDRFVSVVAAADGTVFAGTGNDALGLGGETLFAVGPDGSIQWSREAGDATRATVADGRLLYSSGGVTVDSYDPDTGTRHWRIESEPAGNPATDITVADGNCFTESSTETEEGYPIVAHSLADGSRQWAYAAAPQSGINFVSSGVAAVPDDVAGGSEVPSVVGGEYDGAVFGLAADGTELWTFRRDGDAGGGPLVDEHVYVGGEDGTLYALDTVDGTELWRVSLPGVVDVAPLAEGVLAVGRAESRRTLASVRPDGTERWRYTTSEDLTELAVDGNRVYAGTGDGTLLAFAP